MSTFYGGVSKDGKSNVLVIEGKNWHWKKSKFLTRTFSHLPVGTKFSIQSEREDNSITVDWDTLDIHNEYMDDKEIKEYILNDACAKKNRSLASAKKKLDAENLRNLTVGDLREKAMWMSKAQRQALVSLVISELM